MMRRNGVTLAELLVSASIILLLFATISIAHHTGIVSAVETGKRARLTVKSLNTMEKLNQELTGINENTTEVIPCDGFECPPNSNKLRYKIPIADKSPIADTIYNPDGEIKYGAEGVRNCYYEIFLNMNNQLVKRVVCGAVLCNTNGTCDAGEDAGNCCTDCLGAPSICGDGTCCELAGEDCNSCLDDCTCTGSLFRFDFNFDFIGTAYADTTDKILGRDISNVEFDITGDMLKVDLTLDRDGIQLPMKSEFSFKNQGEVVTTSQCNENSICEDGESHATCPSDCGDCGDGTCEGDETCGSCPDDCDCPAVCGDGTCDEAEETCESCPEDCGVCPCGNGSCDFPESCSSCPQDCGTCPPVCGDGTCDRPGEGCQSCMIDCGLCYCGNGYCEGNEDADRCPEDCDGGGPIVE